MRVMHVISGIRPAAGGTTYALAGLTRAQADAGLEVAVFSTWGEGDEGVGLDLFDNRVRMHQLGPAANPMSRHPQLARHLWELADEYDVFHIHALWEAAQFHAARTAQQKGLAHLFTPHGMLEPWSMGQNWWKSAKKRLYLWWRLRKALNGSDAIHFTTPLEEQHAARLHLRPTTLVEPNGLDLSEFEYLPSSGFLRSRLSIQHNAPILLFLGRIHPKKGLDVTVQAFAQMLRRTAPDSDASRAVLVLAGPDSAGYLSSLLLLASQLGVRDRILTTGMLDAKQRIAAMVDADLFILSSYNENYGVAVIEAMAAELPVLVSDQVQAYPEVLACDGGQVLPLDAETFAAAMAMWLGDAQRCTAAGRRGREHAMNHLGWNQIAERWVGHYERMVASRR